MSTVSSTSVLFRPEAKKAPLADIVDILGILPLKVRLAEDGGRITCTDTCSASDADHSDIHEDLAAEPRFAGPVGLPPGLAPPPGLGLEVADGFECLGGAAAPAKRTALRSKATAYSPLSSYAEAFVPRTLERTRGPRPRRGGDDPKAPGWTTVMMRNIPFSYTCDSLIDLLESKGFSGWFDFVYVPIKRTEVLSVGYGFVNLTSPERVEELWSFFEGFDDWPSSISETACSMRWSICQGLGENIRRYQNCPFMRDDVPAIYKPVLLSHGVRMPFPQPTKPLPTWRHRIDKGQDGDD